MVSPRPPRDEGDSLLYERLSRRSIPALDGYRAVSVLMVVLFHLGVGRVGPYGVMAFFVLSGFLITWLLLQELQVSSTISLRSFYIRRTLRIFPAFYIFWMLYVAVLVFTLEKPAWGQYFASFLYAGNYYVALNDPPRMAMSHTWSLGMEEQFYLLWPWVFLRFKNNLPSLTRLLSGIIVFVWVYRTGLRLVYHVEEHWLYYAFDTRADHLAIGCLLALLLHRRAGERYFHSVCRHPSFPVVTLVLLAAAMWWCNEYNTTRAFTVGYIVLPLLMAVLLVQWIALSGSAWWRWIDSPVLRYCGRISYSLYLYHWLFRLPEVPPMTRVAIAIPASVAIASVSYYLIEKPFLRLKDRFVPLRTPGNMPIADRGLKPTAAR